MSANTTAGAGSSATSPRPRRPRGRENPAHDDHETHRLEPTVYVLPKAVVIVQQDHTRVEHPERGTDYGAPLPAQTLEALAEVAYGRH